MRYINGLATERGCTLVGICRFVGKICQAKSGAVQRKTARRALLRAPCERHFRVLNHAHASELETHAF